MKFKDFNLNLNFAQYKELDAINNSLLKDINSMGPRALLEKKEIKKGKGILKGKLVEDLLFFPDEVVEDYIIQTDDFNIPTASLLVLANKLVETFKKEEIKIPDRDCEDLILKICEEENLWNKQKADTILAKLDDKFWKYIEVELSKENKFIIDIPTWEKSNELVSVLKNHRFTRDIFTTNVPEYIEVLTQFCYVFTLKINDVYYKIKVLIDLLIVDHKEKKIYIYDLKTGSPYAMGFLSNFYTYNYYLQGGLYSIAVGHLIEKHFPDYKIEDNKFTFIYISTTEPQPYPIKWEMGEVWLNKAWEGFYNGNRYIKGIKELLEEYNFYKENNVIENKKAIEMGGVLQIPFNE